KRRLVLIEFIKTQRANKPRPSVWRFDLGHKVERGKCRRIISSEIVGRTEILPVHHVVVIDLYGSFQFLFSVRKIALLQVDAAQSTVQLSVGRGKLLSATQRHDCVIVLLSTDQNVCPQLK